MSCVRTWSSHRSRPSPLTDPHPTIPNPRQTTISYTLVLTDPGVLDLTSLRGKGEDAWQWLHWIVANIPGDGTAPTDGLEVMPYGPPAPPAGSHRYTFLLFEQATAAIKPPTPAERGSFSARKFAAANGLTPVGASYFLAKPAAATQ